MDLSGGGGHHTGSVAVVAVGDARAGKTALVARASGGGFSEVLGLGLSFELPMLMGKMCACV